MNRIFDPAGQGWPEFPRTAYARLDHVEPPNPIDSEEAVFAFGAVDARWSGFLPGGPFDLSDPRKITSQMRNFWSSAFREKHPLPPAEDPFEEMPVYQIEVTSRPGDAYWQLLTNYEEGEWLTIELRSTGITPVDVYGGLLAAAVPAYLTSVRRTDNAQSWALAASFDIDLGRTRPQQTLTPYSRIPGD